MGCGNDVMGCGNDVMGCGNDVMDCGNDGVGVGMTWWVRGSCALHTQRIPAPRRTEQQPGHFGG